MCHCTAPARVEIDREPTDVVATVASACSFGLNRSAALGVPKARVRAAMADRSPLSANREWRANEERKAENRRRIEQSYSQTGDALGGKGVKF